MTGSELGNYACVTMAIVTLVSAAIYSATEKSFEALSDPEKEKEVLRNLGVSCIGTALVGMVGTIISGISANLSWQWIGFLIFAGLFVALIGRYLIRIGTQKESP